MEKNCVKDDKRFYVYAHIYASGPKQGEAFYIGKGTACRARNPSGRSIWWKRIVAKYGRKIRYVKKKTYEPCSFTIERIMIYRLGRGKLCNLTDGGEGNSGITEDNRTAKSIAFSGSKNPFHDGDTYSLYHPKYGKLKTTKFLFRRVFKMTSPNLSKLISGKQMYMKGWTKPENAGVYKGTKYRPNSETRSAIETYVHEDGTIWTGPRDEFAKMISANWTNLYKLRKGMKKKYKGWHLPADEPERVDVMKRTG